ncbi:MAG TPA: CHAD domain-containing protein [Acidobacteriota bacterium]|nr:CHAD domain-containing protein [Acidobacteriota bacterium]
MRSEELSDFHHEQSLEIERLLPAAARCEEEAIHQFRLCVKRLRAFYKAVERVDSGFPSKEKEAEIKQVFKAAGNVRDVQVQRRLALQWQEVSRIALQGYLGHLEDLERDRRPPLQEACSALPEDVLKQRQQEIEGLLRSRPPEDLLKALDAYLEELVEQLHEMAAAEQKEDGRDGHDPHRVRILTKQIRYVAEAALSSHPRDARLAALVESMKALHDPLGDWHDRRVATRFADRFLEENPSEIERERVKLFQRSMVEEEEAFLDAFRENWQAFAESSSTVGAGS